MAEREVEEGEAKAGKEEDEGEAVCCGDGWYGFQLTGGN